MDDFKITPSENGFHLYLDGVHVGTYKTRDNATRRVRALKSRATQLSITQADESSGDHGFTELFAEDAFADMPGASKTSTRGGVYPAVAKKFYRHQWRGAAA